MATKKKKARPQREITKRQLSRWQQQKRRQRIIFSVGVFVIVAALAVVGAGWYIDQYKPLHQTVIRVNETSFNMDYYIKALKFYGGDQSSISRLGLTGEAVASIQRNELIRQGAMKLGISVDQNEVDEELKRHGPPFNDAHRDIVGSQLLVSRLQDEYFEKEVPLYAEQRQILAMLLESEAQATEVRLRLEEGEGFADLAGELSLESLTQAENGALGWRSSGVLMPLFEEHVFSAEVGVLSQPVYDEEIVKNVGYWLIEVLEREEASEEAHVRVILLGSEEETRAVRTRLEAGEDFATLVEEMSQLEWSKEDGGDLGLVTSGVISPVFDEFVFSEDVELGVVSQPIRDDTAATEGGYWLIKIVDKDDNRLIEENDRELLKAEAFRKWVETLWSDPGNRIENYLDDEQQAWAIERAVRR